MPELLFELGCEEIPAEDLEILSKELPRIATEQFDQNRFIHSNVRAEVGPRRLTLVADIDAMQREVREQKLGPPKRVAFDQNGVATQAGTGFAKNLKIPFREVKVVTTPKGEYLAAEIVIPAKPAEKILKTVMPEIVKQLPFRKYMKWGSGDYVFGRPIRNILCLFDNKVIRFHIAGVSANRFTFGHRFLGKNKIVVNSFTEYQKALEENGVILRFADRSDRIERELDSNAAEVGGTLREDPELLNIMANEVEYPEVLSGSFAPEFLALPQEILMNAMRKHQKYFCAVDESGRLLSVFFTVLNTHPSNRETIRKGHERVLTARLRDAEFFWREDRKQTLDTRRPLLDRVTFNEKLGPDHKSYSKKIERTLWIVEEIVVRQLKKRELQEILNHLVNLSKTDLVTHVVGEFPDLQGIMAGLYAKQEGFPEDQWQALYDQYLPVSADDPLPRNELGALLSLSDRIESLVTGYVLNMIPTGSRDPYALRRVATGAMRIILEYQFHLNLRELFEEALKHAPMNRAKATPAELVNALTELMESRFRFLMDQKGIAHDYQNAILNVEQKSFVTAAAKLYALWAKHTSEDLKTLARCFKRINNIIFDQPQIELNENLLLEDGEKRLLVAFQNLHVQQYLDRGEYQEALDIMVTLGPEIDNFFDEVLVMTEDASLRNNRVALLRKISDLYRQIADFSALQIEL